jgi:ribosomal protein S9
LGLGKALLIHDNELKPALRKGKIWEREKKEKEMIF